MVRLFFIGVAELFSLFTAALNVVLFACLELIALLGIAGGN